MATPTTTFTTTISKLGPFDVLCGRDKQCTENPGNIRFRCLIHANLPRYMGSHQSKFERSMAIRVISRELQRGNSNSGSIRFFKRVSTGSGDEKNQDPTSDALVELLDEKESHVKIAHALRDCAKLRKRRESKKLFPASATTPETTTGASSNYHRDQNNIKFGSFSNYSEHHRVSPSGPIRDLTEVEPALALKIEPRDEELPGSIDKQLSAKILEESFEIFLERLCSSSTRSRPSRASSNTTTDFSSNLQKHLAIAQKNHDEMIGRRKSTRDWMF